MTKELRLPRSPKLQKRRKLIDEMEYQEDSPSKKRKTKSLTLNKNDLKQTDFLNSQMEEIILIDIDDKITNTNETTSQTSTLPSKMMIDMNIQPKFYEPHPFSDRLIMISDVKFYVDYYTLSLWSPYFQLEMKENESLRLDNIVPNQFDMLLYHIYPPCPLPRSDIVFELIEIAERFLMKELINRCIDMMMGMDFNMDIAVVADKFKGYEKGKVLYEKVIPWMINNFKAVTMSPKVDLLSKECLIEIMRKHVIQDRNWLLSKIFSK